MVKTLRALDLFCGAGGVTKGLQRAGFHVTGVDLKPQPNYCGERFIQADATTFAIFPEAWDFIHASPPCQGNSTLKHMPGAKKHEDLIPIMRERLRTSGVPYSIENVPGADMDIERLPLLGIESGVVLCGSMFGLGTEAYELRRHRLFETSHGIPQPTCKHGDKAVVGFYGDHARIRRREAGTHRGLDICGKENKLRLVKDLMQIDWMTWSESNQAIPPAYSHYIATQIMRAVAS